MSLKIYRSLEKLKSTPKLLDKFIKATGINVPNDVKANALVYLEVRHLIIHNNSKADAKFNQMNNAGLVKVNPSNNKITINFALANSAITSVFILCKTMEDELKRIGLV